MPSGKMSRYPLLAILTAAILACSPKGEALYERAEKSLEAGEVRAAIIDLKNFAKDDPSNPKARVLLATALIQNGELAAAEIEIEKARQLGASPNELLLPECHVLVSKGEFAAVLEKCRTEEVPPERKAEMEVLKGRALMGMDRAAEAKLAFASALEARPESLEALLGLASATYETVDLPAAMRVMDGAPAALQRSARYWMARGSFNMQGGDAVAAEGDFSKAVSIAGEDSQGAERLMALGALAEAQMMQGKVKEATQTADQLIEAAPNNPVVKQLRGQVAAAGGDLEHARTLLEEAVAAMPENYQARTQLGIVNLRQGNLGQAEMHFAYVASKKPTDIPNQRLLAETRARLTSPGESLDALKPALLGSDPSLLAMAGRMSLASGDREQALAYLAQAATQAGGSQEPNVQLEIASGYLMAGDLDKAVEVLEKIPLDGATGFQREYLLMVALMRKGEQDKAIAEAEALLQRSGSDPEVRNLVAGVYAAAGRKDAARQQFEEALRLKPGHSAALINLARLDLSEGNAGDAASRFRQVLEDDPGNMVATLGLAVAAESRGDSEEAEKWLTKASNDHPDSVDAQVALAQFYMAKGDFAKSLAVIDKAVARVPDNAALLNARGLVLLGQKDIEGAIRSLQQAVSLAPKAYGYSLGLARAHIANRDVKSALGVLDRVLEDQPQFAPALAMASAVCIENGEFELAAAYMERIRKLAPDAPVMAILDGDLAMAQKRYGDALRSYRKASASTQTRPLMLAEYRAATLAGERRPEAVLENWIKTNPADVGAVALLAEVRQRSGDRDGAISLYEQALEKAPENPVLLNNLAVLYEAKNDSRALPTAEKAYKAAPNAAAMQDTYGWILLKDGKINEALDLLRSALQGMPGNAEVQYHLAAALAAKGEKSEAIELLKKAVNGSMPTEAKVAAEDLLAQLTR